MKNEKPYNPSNHPLPLSAILIPVIAAIVYAARNRTADDFLHAPLYLSVFFVILLAFQLPEEWLKGKALNHSVRDRVVSLTLFGLLPPFVFGYSLYSVGVVALDAYRWAMSWTGTHQQQVILTGLLTLGVGVSLFVLRSRWRLVYGISEAAAGVALATMKALGEKEPLITSDLNFYAAVLTAGIYLVVRGLDNAQQGLKSETDPLARYLRFRRLPQKLLDKDADTSPP